MNLKVLVGASLLLILAGCFGGNSGTAETSPEGFHYYATEDFRMLIPDEWDILTPAHFSSSVPANTLVAFRSNIKGEKFTANVVAVRNNLPEEISSRDYAQAVFRKFSTEIVGFKEIEIKEDSIRVAGQDRASLFIFAEGRETPTGDVKRFIQRSGVNGKQAFIVLGAFLANESEEVTEKIRKMVESFEIK